MESCHKEIDRTKINTHTPLQFLQWECLYRWDESSQHTQKKKAHLVFLFCFYFFFFFFFWKALEPAINRIVCTQHLKKNLPHAQPNIIWRYSVTSCDLSSALGGESPVQAWLLPCIMWTCPWTRHWTPKCSEWLVLEQVHEELWRLLVGKCHINADHCACAAKVPICMAYVITLGTSSFFLQGQGME